MAANLLSTQIGAAAVCAYAIQLAQKWSKLPWITEHTQGINTAMRIVTSGIAAMGITWAWSPGTDGGHVLTIAIPSGAVLLTYFWHWFVQYAIQHGWGNLLTQGPQAAAVPPAAKP